jgi:hypothetical protein
MNPQDIIRGCFDTFAICLPPGEYDGPDHVAWQIVRAAAVGELSLRGHDVEAMERLELLLGLSGLCEAPLRECLLAMLEHRLDELHVVETLAPLLARSRVAVAA